MIFALSVYHFTDPNSWLLFCCYCRCCRLVCGCSYTKMCDSVQIQLHEISQSKRFQLRDLSRFCWRRWVCGSRGYAHVGTIKWHVEKKSKEFLHTNLTLSLYRIRVYMRRRAEWVLRFVELAELCNLDWSLSFPIPTTLEGDQIP